MICSRNTQNGVVLTAHVETVIVNNDAAVILPLVVYMNRQRGTLAHNKSAKVLVTRGDFGIDTATTPSTDIGFQTGQSPLLRSIYRFMHKAHRRMSGAGSNYGSFSFHDMIVMLARELLEYEREQGVRIPDVYLIKDRTGRFGGDFNLREIMTQLENESGPAA